MAEGHRERVKRRFLTEDLESFEAHNALEFLLFYGLPRIDTNGIAHRLIDRFGSFSEVLEAPLDELASVDGVGDNAAIFLKLIHSTVKYYEDDVAEHDEKTPLEYFASGAVFDITRQNNDSFTQIVNSNDAMFLIKI